MRPTANQEGTLLPESGALLSSDHILGERKRDSDRMALKELGARS
jgi:hypothetical protein